VTLTCRYDLSIRQSIPWAAAGGEKQKHEDEIERDEAGLLLSSRYDPAITTSGAS
jgi:hypothetical protein